MKTKLFTLFLLIVFSFSVKVYAETDNSNTQLEATQKGATVQDLLEKMNQEPKKEEVVAAPPVLQIQENVLSKQELQSANTNQNSNILSQAKTSESLPWMKTVLATLFICSLAVVVFLFLNAKGKAGGVFQAAKTQPLKIIQKMNLGLKTDIVLLDFEGTRLLLSVQSSQVQLLQSFQEKSSPQVTEEQTQISVQEKQNKEFQIFEELQNTKNQLHFDAKEKLSTRVRAAVKKLTPLPSALSTMGFQKAESFVEEQNKKNLTFTA